ncbi:hypothetical protein, partial [Duodenibacillus massiliensis]|uniref:hypothetical protein n=1 Tax=Duodenibacillus massiliensis TaxID=1852381 RepID=UPI003AF0E878
MTKDGVRDFIAAEYTLSENYVHGLAAFAPRLKNFESPHSSRGSSPGLSAGNSVNSRLRSMRRMTAGDVWERIWFGSMPGLNPLVP